jgi:hypothetical protein
MKELRLPYGEFYQKHIPVLRGSCGRRCKCVHNQEVRILTEEELSAPLAELAARRINHDRSKSAVLDGVVTAAGL